MIDGLPIWRCAFLPAVVKIGGLYDAGVNAHVVEDMADAIRRPLAEAMKRADSLKGGGEDWATVELADYMPVNLPLPPSVNALFVEAAGRRKGSGRQRVKTKEYKAWQTDAGWILKQAAIQAGATLDPQDPPFADNFGLWIRVDIDHKSDITNRIKAIEDLLVSMGATIGDQWNDRCTIERDRTIPKGTARIVIYRIPGE